MASIVYPAGLWRRLAAAVYDLFLLVGIWIVAVLALLPFNGGEAPAGDSWWFRAYLLFVPCLFFGWFWTHGGQTLGMRAWRFRVVTDARHDLTWPLAGRRFAWALVSWSAAGAGFFWSLVDPQWRTWHDRLSGTRLMRTSPAAKEQSTDAQEQQGR